MSEQVRLMFSEISESYDIGNDVLSFGWHRIWKRTFVKRARAPKGGRVLDLATGTGDIALLFANAVGAQGEVIGTDFTAAMIGRARQRANNKPNLRFELGDAMNIRFADNSFDVASISFGIRNVDNPVKALSEMRRVVRPGGRVAVLEFGQPDGLFGKCYSVYSNKILPRVGGLISGNHYAYDYLNKTSARFPCGPTFEALMREAGIQKITTKKLFNGVAFMYIGEVE